MAHQMKENNLTVLKGTYYAHIVYICFEISHVASYIYKLIAFVSGLHKYMSNCIMIICITTWHYGCMYVNMYIVLIYLYIIIINFSLSELYN